MITKDELREKFEQLSVRGANTVVNIMVITQQEYTNSNVTTPYPQYFYACNELIFESVSEDDMKEYLAIDNVDDFLASALYYTSIFVLKEESNG